MFTSSTPENMVLVDIGGTYVRFYLGSVDAPMTDKAKLTILQVADYQTFEAALVAYLDEQKGLKLSQTILGLSIAAPLTGDIVTLTNATWMFSLSALKGHFAFADIVALNDFAAVAYSIPALRKRHLQMIGTAGTAQPQAPVAVIGPGTGLGMATLVPVKGGYYAVAGEGGHQSVPAKTQRELDVVNWLRDHKYRHVSCERVCSGKGLVNIYTAMCGLAGGNAPDISPEEISGRALDGTDSIATEALDMMLGFLGTIAGNHALLSGALGGVYIAGGIPLRLGEAFFHSRFRQEFEAKGRFEDYLKPIPTYLINHPNVGVLGLDWYLRERHRANIHRVG